MNFPSSEFLQHWRSVRAQLAVAGHRCLILLQGDPAWRRQLKSALWLGDLETESPVIGSNSRQPAAVLGQTTNALTYDLDCGVDIDGFAAATGAVAGGGVIVLETRHLTVGGSGGFLARLLRLLLDDPACWVFQQGKPFAEYAYANLTLTAQRSVQIQPFNLEFSVSRPTEDSRFKTEDQLRATAAVVKLAHGRARRPLLLIADRGRGKSSAMGLAVNQLLQESDKSIVVTGPRKAAVEEIFQRLDQAVQPANKLRFFPVDQLLQQDIAADLLLVDEAAALTTPQLTQLLQRFKRIVFATTVNGYEGNGQGFLLRFAAQLDVLTPGWKKLELKQAIRWAYDDPVEPLLSRLFLFDTVTQPLPGAISPGKLAQMRQLSQQHLRQDEVLLRAVFGLLRMAHYRTSPADLRQLLEQQDSSVMVIEQQGQLVAVALLVAEGGFSDDAFSAAVAAGKRRLKGHLLPQSLALHAATVAAMKITYQRVVRIVVHPDVQRQGAGSWLLQQITQWTEQGGVDCLGVSFAVDVEILRFWLRAGFQPVRMGLRTNAMSGSRSIMLLKPLSPAAQQVVASCRAFMIQELPHLLLEQLSDLDADVVVALLQGMDVTHIGGYSRDHLQSFVMAERSYETTLSDIWKLTMAQLTRAEGVKPLSDLQKRVLVKRVLQKQSSQQVAAACNLRGTKAVVANLRAAVGAALATALFMDEH